MRKQKSISFVVPSFNEERNINNTYLTIIKLIQKKKIKDYEIIFVDDASTDLTKYKINKIIKKNKFCKLIYNKTNRGYGFSLKKGYLKSRKEFVLLIPGDNEHPFSGIAKLFIYFGKYDVVIPFPINKNVRSILRRFLSLIYTKSLNILFNNKIPYYNGLVLYRNKILRKNIKVIQNFTFSFLAELLIRTLKYTRNYKFVGYKIKNQKRRIGSALKIKNIFFSIYFLLKLRVNF